MVKKNTAHDGLRPRSCAVLHYSRSRDAHTLSIRPVSSIMFPFLSYAGIHGFRYQKQKSFENTRETGFNQKFCNIISQPYAGSGFTVESRFRLEGFLSILFPGNPFNLSSQEFVMIQSFKCADIVSCFLCLVNFFENRIVPQIPDLSEQTVHCHSVSGLRCRHSRSLR